MLGWQLTLLPQHRVQVWRGCRWHARLPRSPREEALRERRDEGELDEQADDRFDGRNRRLRVPGLAPDRSGRRAASAVCCERRRKHSGAQCAALTRAEVRRGSTMGYDPNQPNYDPNGPNYPYQNSPFQRNPGNEGYQQYPGAQAYGYPADPALYALDIGLVMRQVYLWLAFGLAVGFGISFALGRALQNDLATFQTTGQVSGLLSIVLNPAAWIVSLVVWFVIGFGFFPIVQRANLAISVVLYTIFAAVFGFWTSLIFLEYTTASIEVAFVTTTGMFAVMSVIGYITNVDLSRFGPILLMALVGLIIASLVNLFVHNTVLYWVVSYAGVVIFCGLTAYDTQWIKRRASAVARSGKAESAERVALMGAFKLFLDFINLFMFLVRIQGRSR